jgi:hypothetical protein
LYAYVANDPVNATDPTGMAGKKEVLKQGASYLRKLAEERRLTKNARAQGRRAALKNERRDLIETGQSKSQLSETRQEELVQTGKLRNMDGHHEPSISSGRTPQEKIEIAKNPENITFMEKPDHQALHGELGGTQVPIPGPGGDAVVSVLLGAAVVLEAISEVADYIPELTMILHSEELGCATITPCEQ